MRETVRARLMTKRTSPQLGFFSLLFVLVSVPLCVPTSFLFDIYSISFSLSLGPSFFTPVLYHKLPSLYVSSPSLVLLLFSFLMILLTKWTRTGKVRKVRVSTGFLASLLEMCMGFRERVWE